jgi:hypothetical protein
MLSCYESIAITIASNSGWVDFIGNLNKVSVGVNSGLFCFKKCEFKNLKT